LTPTPKTSAPDRLTGDEKRELLGWVKSKAHPVRGPSDPFFLKLAKSPKLIAYHVDACLLHFKDRPEVKRPGWVATCQKWILKAAGFAEEQRTQHGEKPQMSAPRGRVGSPVADVIRDIETAEMFEGE
jgi:hypothetical protein